ncbi:DUF4272 domain-containing protein [Saccharibacillus sp. VR-M41]|uniref:DUF4272 domain-containing protein n=1 Tax=Saccharibacillus alkalitolerans TaxID=2705290 RepID=A0ABX0FDE0_9BACL|nr:DUF4272 domain-containing protein [Saccharibacillus alkalitolerans]
MQNAALYSSNFDLAAVAEALRDIFGDKSVSLYEEGTYAKVKTGSWLGKSEYGFRSMTSRTEPEKFGEMQNGMYHFFAQIPAEKPKVHEKLLIKLQTLNMVIGIESDKAFSHAFQEQIYAMARKLDAIVLMGTRSMMDGEGRLLLDLDGRSEVDDFTVTAHTSFLHEEKPPSAEALLRKERSELLLREQGVPVNVHLPAIEEEEETTIRSLEEIARRAVALCVSAVKGESDAAGEEAGETRGLIERIIGQYEADDFFTERERFYLEESSPERGTIATFSWGYESYWVMLWALGFVERLDRPDQVCDVGRAVSILQGYDSFESFVRAARLRSKQEIMDEADLIYRYDWACVDARINNRQAPAGLDAGVVYERHRSLNWLIGYMGQEWDHVTTDT